MIKEFQARQTDRTIEITSWFDATRDLVFRMFSDSENLKQWWGPETWPVRVSHLDFRVGGSWHYAMVGPDGTEAWGKATYLKIVEPEIIVYDDVFSNADGQVDDSLPVAKCTVELIEEDNGTRLILSSLHDSETDAKKIVEMGAIEGMRDTWEHLGQILASKQGR